MRFREITEAVGRITKQNQTSDVGPQEIKTQAAKFGNTVDKDGRPPTLSKKTKGSKTNVLYNLGLAEKWSKKYKDSIDCSNPKGFSQRAHCKGKKKKQTENFDDGKKKGKSRPGRAKRAGVDCSKSVSALRKQASNSSGEKQKMAHWCANMKSGRKKS